MVLKDLTGGGCWVVLHMFLFRIVTAVWLEQGTPDSPDDTPVGGHGGLYERW